MKIRVSALEVFGPANWTTNYLFSVVFPVDFVLKDPSERAREKAASKTPARMELDIVPKPWAKSVEASYTAINQSLYVTNPTLRQVLSLWYKSYTSMRFINTKSLLTHGEVIELAVYQGAIVRDVESVRNKLIKG